jgi:hypothetical protein
MQSGSTQTAFAEKHWLLTLAHKLAEETWHACLHFVSVFALHHFLYSRFIITLDSKSDRTDNIFMTINWGHLELPPSQWGQLFW